MSSTSDVLTAARALHAGGALLYPTETVYGLGCQPSDTALARILSIKNRSGHKGMILIAARREFLEPFCAPLPAAIWTRICRPQRRATTWLVPASKHCPALLKGQFATVAVRITRHKLSATLSHASRSAIVSTSANPSGQNPTRHASTLASRIRRRTPLVLRGNCGRDRNPSQIRDALSGKVIANRIR